jgi:hypothetical protein
LLAFGKILIALSFLGYFVSKDHDNKFLSVEQNWPRNDIRAPRKIDSRIEPCDSPE